MRSAKRRKVNVLETKCLRSLVGVMKDRVRNEDVRRSAGIERELASIADQRVWRWFGHVQRIYEYRLARRVLMAEVSGERVQGRPRLGWMDGVKVALSNRGMTVEAARQCARDWKEWRALGMSFTRPICLALCSFGPPSRALVVITWRGVGCRNMMPLG